MSWLGSIAGGGTKPSDANRCMESSCNVNLGSFWAWFKSRLHLGVAGVDARRATPPDPRLARWELASCCQLDPSHPAFVPREDPGVEPSLIPCGSSLSLSRLLAWPVLRCPLLEQPGIGSAWQASHATKCYVFPAFSKIWKSGFRRKLLMNRWLWLFGSRRSFRR